MSLDSIGEWSRRAAGLALLAFIAIPFWNLLAAQTGPVAAEAVVYGRYHWSILIRDTVLALFAGVVLSFVVGRATWNALWKRAEGGLSAPPIAAYALALAVIAAVVSGTLALMIWDNRPSLIDVMAQLIQARYLARGALSGPADIPFEFWVSANTLLTDHGWVSQYPPGHVALLAAGFMVGAVWLVAPLIMGVCAFFTALAAERLLPDDKVVARIGALFFAVSPFALTIAASYMNHVTAAALGSVAAYFALRARDGSWAWAVPAGAAVGWMFGTRPLTAVTVGAVVTLGIWLTGVTPEERRSRFLTLRLAGSAAGALPFVVAVAVYNATFFRSPFRFGYLAYMGPGHRFGFHPDPWGNAYDAADAVGYTSSDLLALGHGLFQSPLSVVLIVAVFLVVAPRLTRGLGIVTAWALVLIVPLAFYWHHDLVLGPRMLSDVAPAWCMLSAGAAIGLVRWCSDRTVLAGHASVRSWAGVTLAASFVSGLVLFAPQDLHQYARRFASRVEPPTISEPSLVFVHDTWGSRTTARLVAAGMRADSVAIALDQNASCRLDEFARARSDGAGAAPPIVLTPGRSDGSRPERLPFGVTVRIRPGEELTPDCLREARSDRLGTIPLMPLLWQGDLPGVERDLGMYVRDMGPEHNATLIERFPQRRPMVLLREESGGPVALVPYSTGMELLWGRGGSF